MKAKYVKPLARQMGNALQTAHGVCYSNGSIARTSAGSHCTPGGTASGGTCIAGTTVSGCVTQGLVPDTGYSCLSGGTVQS